MNSLPQSPTVLQSQPTQHLRVCPECSGPLVHRSACVSCLHCGWGRCE